MSQLLEEYRSLGYWPELARQASRLVILGRQPRLTEEDWARFQEVTNNQSSPDRLNTSFLLGHLSSLSVLGARSELKSEDRQNFGQVLSRWREEENWGQLIEAAMYSKVLNLEAPLDDQAKRSIQTSILASRASHDWHTFVTRAGWYRILAQPVQLQEGDWQGIQLDLESHRLNKHWLDFSTFASSMAILAADEVRIPPGGGLELVWKKDSHQAETPSMPSTRKF